MRKPNEEFSAASHFEGKHPAVRATYKKLIAESKKFGKVREEPKKTSIHLMNGTAFGGVATRKSNLILTIKYDEPLKSPRVFKSEQVSAKRYHHKVKLSQPEDVDAELLRWLKRSYEMSK